MRIAWYTYVATFICLLTAPSLLAQDFLKQLEQRLFQKQQEAKGNVDKAKDKPAEPIQFPSVLEPAPAPDAEELPPKKPTISEAESLELPPPKRTAASDSDKTTPAPAKAMEAGKGNRSLLSPFPAAKPKANIPTQPIANPGGGYLGLTVDQIPGGGFGLTVVDVTPDSPAWKAGFRNGDRVIGVSGQAVTTIDAFAEQLSKFSAGVPVKFLVDRRGRQANLVAVLQDRVVAGKVQGNVPGTAIELSPDASISSGRAFFGVNVSDMSDGFRKQFAIPAYRGASVTSVVPGSPAEAAGLRPGDCIVDIDGKTVQNAEAVLDSILRGRPGQVISVSYYRGRQMTTASVALSLDQPPAIPSTAYMPLNPSAPEVRPEMLTPEYVASLQNELERVNSELANAQQRMQQLEARLQALEKRR
ncbi:MAG: PDZ domain-containing protein [Pirellula sp.]